VVGDIIVNFFTITIILLGDYCGHGILHNKTSGTFQISSSDEGHVDAIIKDFANEREFVEWLAKQSDYSLGGFDKNDKDLYSDNNFIRGNQRVTRQVLEEYLQ